MKLVNTRGFRSLVVLLVAGGFVLSGQLRPFVPSRWGPGGIRLTHLLTRFPLLFQVNDKAATGTPNLGAGSDALAAIRASLAAWGNIQTSAVRFADIQLTSVESPIAGDGVNLITLADTPANREILGGDKDTGTLALTRLVFVVTNGKISDADILVNPRYRFSTTLDPGTFDLQSIITHELGHVLGCDHASALNDTMFFQIGEQSFYQRYLSPDSVAFVSFTYPSVEHPIPIGNIWGRVTRDGRGVFGASVATINLDRNLIYTTLTESDGSYSFAGPGAGRYAVYAEPLNGPVKPDQLMGSGSSNGYYTDLDVTFRTTIADQQLTPSIGLSINDGQKQEVNLEVTSRTATLNIDRIGKGDPNTGVGYLAAGPVTVNPGEIVNLYLGGPQTWKLASLDDVQILGTGIVVDHSRPARVLADKSGSEVGIGFLVQVASDAGPGPRTVVIKVGDEQAAGTGGVVVTPRSIPAAILYFPYLLATQDHYTGIALVNTSLTPAAVRIVARDGQGVLLYDRGAVIPADLAIAPAAQIARLERQIFNLPANPKQAGSVIVESDNREVQGFFLAGDLSSNYLDGAEAFTSGRKELCFPDILQNADTTTEIHLMNTKDIAASVQLALIGGSGGILKGPLLQTIPPFGKIGKSVAELFGVKTDLNAAHVTAQASDQTIAGFSYVRQRDAAFGLNAQSPESASDVLYSPQLAVGKFGVTYRTRLNIVNAGGSPATVTVELLGDNGLPLSGTGRYTPPAIAAGGQLAVDAETYFGLAGRGSLQGSIRVSAQSGSKLMGNVVFGDGDPTKGRLDFGAALPLSSSGSTDFIFSQVAEGNGFYTGLALMAREGATVLVAAYTQDGKLVGNESLTLAPNARSVSLLQALVPATRGQVGGYLRVTSTKPVIGFELFGATSGRFLSAVPPQRLLY